MALFDRKLVYPQDRYGGRFIELEGKVVEVEGGCDVWLVRVETEKGTFRGVEERLPPEVGFKATIRIYDAGGGFYPDNRIMGWSRP